MHTLTSEHRGLLPSCVPIKSTDMVSAWEDQPVVKSRSNRRKKAKRLFYRTFGSKNEKKLIKNEIENKILEGDSQKKPPEHVNADQNCNEDEELVPIIVRPGHIHFGPSAAVLVKVSNEKAAFENVDVYEKSIANRLEPAKECNGKSVSKEFEAVKEILEFESFPPLVRLPEEGDVLIYRVVELSTSWCPELSPFRVGKVSSYDCSSSKVVLLPLPEYPFTLEEISEEGQESWSSYKEDGTLAVDFASLVDVRLLEATESIKTTSSTISVEELQNAVLVNNQEIQTSAPMNNQEAAYYSSSRIQISSNHTENEQLCDGWEDINQALEEKKIQLQKQNDSDERNSSITSSKSGAWSYSAMRRNALGPTLAILRSSNGDSDK